MLFQLPTFKSLKFPFSFRVSRECFHSTSLAFELILVKQSHNKDEERHKVSTIVCLAQDNENKREAPLNVDLDFMLLVRRLQICLRGSHMISPLPLPTIYGDLE